MAATTTTRAPHDVPSSTLPRGRPSRQQHHRKSTTSLSPVFVTAEQFSPTASIITDSGISLGWDYEVEPEWWSSPSPSSSDADDEDEEAEGSASSLSEASSVPILPEPASSSSLASVGTQKGPTVATVRSSKLSSDNTLPKVQTALLVHSNEVDWDQAFKLHHDWPLLASAPDTQMLGHDEIFVRNVAVGLNQVDFKSLVYKFGIERFPAVLGRDVVGVVEAVGSSAEKGGLQRGDRVWTCCDSRDARSGGFQSFSVAKSHTLGRLPCTSIVSDEAGATIGTGLVTAGVALHWFFELSRARVLGGGKYPKPHQPAHDNPARRIDGATEAPRLQQWILIYGGGTVTGSYAAQLAHLSGLKVISVASPSNFSYLSSIGVDVCVDRFAPSDEILARIQQATSNGDLAHALDCVGSATATLCRRALESTTLSTVSSHSDTESADRVRHRPAQLICLAGNPKRDRPDDDADQHQPQPEGDDNGAANPSPQRRYRDVQTPRLSFSTTFYACVEFSTAFLSDVHELLAQRALRPVHAHVLPGGLQGVKPGLEMLRDGHGVPNVSAAAGGSAVARKLVVRIDETPEYAVGSEAIGR
ncbi:unnamed protein product [Jaminaea pallidilutea]